MTESSEGRQRRQRVCSDVRGSAATSEGWQRRGEVGSDVERSTATSEGQQERYGVPWMDVASLGWTWRPLDGCDVIRRIILRLGTGIYTGGCCDVLWPFFFCFFFGY